MSRQTAPTPATVDLVWDRDKGACARCGKPLFRPNRGVDWSLHHRRPRGMGGTRETWVNLPGNLVLLCGSGTTGCHGWVEGNRATATDVGWLVSRLARYRSTDVPVFHALHGMVRLIDDGSVEPVKEAA